MDYVNLVCHNLLNLFIILLSFTYIYYFPVYCIISYGCVEGQWITGKLDLVEMSPTDFGVEPRVKEYKSTKGGDPSYGAVREGQE